MSSGLVSSLDEFERWRRMIPVRPDWHLHNWGCWRRGYHLTQGFRADSVGMGTGGASGQDAFQHLCEPVDLWAATVSNTVIEDLELLHRTIIGHVYEAAVWHNQRINMPRVFVEAAAEFWKRAVKKDLT